MLVIGRHGDLAALAPTSDRVRPGRGPSASGGLAGARLHAIASLQLMSSATRQVVCLQDFTLSKWLEHAELRGCYRVRPDLPTNCGSPVRDGRHDRPCCSVRHAKVRLAMTRDRPGSSTGATRCPRATVGAGTAPDRGGKVNTSQDVDLYSSGIERAGEKA